MTVVYLFLSLKILGVISGNILKEIFVVSAPTKTSEFSSATKTGTIYKNNGINRNYNWFQIKTDVTNRKILSEERKKRHGEKMKLT